MEINLYLGETKTHLNYFTDFFTLQNIRFKIYSSYFGNRININIDSNKIYLLSSHICKFILDFFIKEAVVSKIYDEYPLIDTVKAGEILSELSEKITASPINNSIYNIINEHHSFNPSSYVMFNMKSIMTCAYFLTDQLCQKYVCEIEKEMIVSLLSQYNVEISEILDYDNENN
ncbi:MAG: hypothetical protein J6R68_07555 [Clostridia bacterium]|nr:hypothetical protein [Clostridia bacterium]